MVRLFFVLVILWPCLPAFSQSNPPATDNYYYLYRSSDGRVKPADQVKLTPQKLSVNGIIPADSLLDLANIFPDAEAYHLIYQLNPNITSLKQPYRGVLLVPAFDPVTKSLLGREKADGFVLVVTTDYAAKKKLLDQITAIDQANPCVAPDPKNSASRALFCDAIAKLDNVSGCIGKRSFMTDSYILEQLGKEAALLQQLLHQVTLTQDDRAKLHELDDDLALVAANLYTTRGPGDVTEPYPATDVTANVLDAKHKPVSGLRIVYVPKALVNDATARRSISTLSSPATAHLAVANYFFWAFLPGETAEATERLAVEVRIRPDHKPYPVDLAQKKAALKGQKP